MKAQLLPAAARSPVLIRAITPGDAEQIRTFYAALSDDSRRLRFMSAGAAVSALDAQFMCGPDHLHREGFVALAGTGDRRTIVGHLCLEPRRPGEAELAVAVADSDQGRGVGRRLTAEAVRWASARGIDRLSATCATDNARIVRLFRGLGRPMTFGSPGCGSIDLVVDVSGTPNPCIVAA